MKFDLERDRICITAESKQDEAYLEDTMGLTLGRIGDGTAAVLVAYVEARVRKALIIGSHPDGYAPSDLPGLVDNGFTGNAAAKAVDAIGGPKLSELASRYGSNHFNKG